MFSPVCASHRSGNAAPIRLGPTKGSPWLYVHGNRRTPNRRIFLGGPLDMGRELGVRSGQFSAPTPKVNGGNMRGIKHAFVCGTAFFVAGFSAFAQGTAGTVASVEMQTPKSGTTQQYEQGRKQKADWHKQQKDSQPLFVFEIIAGDTTGSYYVARLGQHWADMDKPSVPDAADTEEYNKVIGAYVQSVVTRYWEFLPKISNPEGGTLPAKYSEVLTFRVRYGKQGAFRSAIARFSDAAQKAKWPVHFEFYALELGGSEGTYAVLIPHANWADFEDKPDVKPFREMLKDALGQDEADSVVDRLNSSVEGVSTEIIEFRQDLSYVPAK